MTRSVRAKICGINTVEAMHAAESAGADYVGFIFYPPSPRYVAPAFAGELAADVAHARKVAVLVDADDQTIGEIVESLVPDLLQLHGNHSPEQVAVIKKRFGVDVLTAFSVETSEELRATTQYNDVSDMFLFDAKPPKTPDALPGGNAVSFDWRILQGETFARPWFLSGGLTPDNVAAAVASSGALFVDVSSGVETAPGKKDAAKIAAFIAALEETDV